MGCGPAGLIAAHTLFEYGVRKEEIDIVSDRVEKSVIGGAQYLHKPILSDLRGPDFTINTVHIGNESGYAEKVYGNDCFPTSFGSDKGEKGVWDLRKTYAILWADWSKSISKRSVTAGSLSALAEDYRQVIVAAPAMHFCNNSDYHDFPSMEYVLVTKIPADLWMDDVVIYNGRGQDDWYRYSSIRGHQWLEFSAKSSSMVEGVIGSRSTVVGKKPMGTDCDCCERLGVIRAGRLSTWDRKVLLHDVVDQVRRAL